MMKRTWFVTVAIAVLAAVFGVSESVMASQSFGSRMVGFEEVPSISTAAHGFLVLNLNDAETALDYTLVYFGFQATPTVAHIHFGHPGVAAGISAFLCGGGGKPSCPASGVFLSGTVTASDVIGPTAQGIAAGDFSALVRAIRGGVTYSNVHSVSFPTGEIRGQLR